MTVMSALLVLNPTNQCEVFVVRTLVRMLGNRPKPRAFDKAQGVGRSWQERIVGDSGR